MKNISIGLLMVLVLTGCMVNPVPAFKLDSSNLHERGMQSRVYRGIPEQQILAASAALFQDLGFNITASETELGLK